MASPSASIALGCFVLATALGHWSLAWRRTWAGRYLDAISIMALSMYGLTHASSLGSIYAAQGTYQVTMIWFFPYTVRRLLVDYPPLDKLGSPMPRWSIYEAYKVWCNPRDVPDPNNDPFRGTPSSKGKHFLHVLLMITIRFLTTALIIPILAKILIGPFYVSDFSVDKIFPGLFDLTGLDIAKRAYLVFDWFWFCYNSLCIFHHILSILHVCLFRLDEPEEWPPLFGSWRKADSLRRFWGTCWHNLLSPTYIALATYLARDLLLLPQGARVTKVFVVACVYAAAAILHGLISWLDGDPKPWTFAAYYVVQFLGTAAEACVMGSTKRNAHGPLRIARGVAGWLWVVVWFLVTTSPLIYSQMASAAAPAGAPPQTGT
ncbi:uncharacterized protein F5Z01DRAFT_233265 [Emericellopsis atlantica]|uniref:Wax synthase domain-containing protein n=1 Tax=Emericellopsis atlantica TaxID=2614577 RepID=A0A9P7ZI62_9HYPO|nr:uncharacterized protein F5Z01DRAFT_233265 [Emericellopsis atlantica]KAG9252559.1 hypothetical protein F5Z01DRAFT_233265 [Emericellopsis atlantica]